MRNVNINATGWVSYRRQDALYTNFSITAPEIIVLNLF